MNPAACLLIAAGIIAFVWAVLVTGVVAVVAYLFWRLVRDVAQTEDRIAAARNEAWQ